MSDVQDESTQLDSEQIEDKALMDEVVEERPVVKKKSSLGSLFFLLFIVGIASAGWYFQPLWFPQAKQSYEHAQLMMHDFMSEEKVAPIVAATPDAQSESQSQEDDTAIAESEAIQEEEVAVGTFEGEQLKDTEKFKGAKGIVIVAQEVSQNVAENVEPIQKLEPKSVTETEPHAQATFIEPAVAEKSSPSVNKEASKETSVAENKTVSVDLVAARQAFWQRNLPKAEALYKQQVENTQANADAWGELGNVYYLQAKWLQAASAYTEAALLLLDKGDFPQAMFMRYIVFGLDPKKIKRIDDRVKALQAPLHG